MVQQAVENRVGHGRIADDLVPAIDRYLAGDDGRASLVTILDDLQQVTALLVIELLRAPIVDDEQVDPGEAAQQLGVAAITTRQDKGREQPRRAVVGDREVLPAGL